ncbi:hypothetical protein IWZ01DRAFT_226759 [Phyllosticta capitalensis]
MNHFITATHLEAMVPKMKALRSFVECSFPFLIRGCLAKEPRVVITGLTIGLIYFAPTRPPILHKSPASPASNFSIQRPTSFENLPLPVVLSTLKSQARPDSGISSPLFISSRGNGLHHSHIHSERPPAKMPVIFDDSDLELNDLLARLSPEMLEQLLAAVLLHEETTDSREDNAGPTEMGEVDELENPLAEETAREPDSREDVAGHIEMEDHRVGWPRLVSLRPYHFEDVLHHLFATGQLDAEIPRWREIVDATRHIMGRYFIPLYKMQYGEQVIQGPGLRTEAIPIFRVIVEGWGTDVPDWQRALVDVVEMLRAEGLDCGATHLHVEIVYRFMPYSFHHGW